jgi:valyl-tRNA synthetase
VPHGDRSGVVIEPWLTEQWYVDVKSLAEKAMAAVRSGETRMHPPEREKIFFNWLENIEPWCVSRQLWWGHQIPAWYGPDRHVFVAMNEAEAQHQADAHYGRVVPLARDPDVLDTWFSSALWPYSTLGWPAKTPELAKFYPNDVLVTAADILFFWVARMMMTGLHFMDETPFRDVILHGIVRDEKGKKMSKTTGNVIDPLTVIDQYGADALRFTLAAMTQQGRDIKLAMSRVEGYRNFATKVWNAVRFGGMNAAKRVDGFDPAKARSPLNRWLVGEAAKASAEVSAAIEGFRFGDAADAAYRFVWGTYCDWFIELSKPVLQGDDSPQKAETLATIAWAVDVVAKLLHPFMPYLTEEIWAATAGEGAARPPQKDGDLLLCLADWPELSGLEDAEAEAEIGWVVDLISEIRSVRSEMNVPAGAQAPLVFVASPDDVRARVARWDCVIRRLARIDALSFAEAAPALSAAVQVRRDLAALPLGDLIDVPAERIRLAKEIGKLEGEAGGLEKKLANAEFVAKAPEEVVEENRERLETLRLRRVRLGEALRRLG